MAEKKNKMGIFKEFLAFIEKGSAIDMAVGIIVGSVMTSLVNSLVKDIIMPPIGMMIGGVDFSNWFVVINKGVEGLYAHAYPTLAAAQAAGATTINLGLFLNACVSFLITMFAVFMIVRVVNKIRGQKPITTRVCPYCKTSIDRTASKCPNCCSKVTPLPPEKPAEGCEIDEPKIVCKIKKIVESVKKKK
ncbi:MAG: large conductance mechanosensitive channel protein MscL [Rickettsiales bacterium]|jgi:large conductance mechanosensitive channel|nr:large conductance mechanosensitive channel protein MscL [Rickettsiales bacterium]